MDNDELLTRVAALEEELAYYRELAQVSGRKRLQEIEHLSSVIERLRSSESALASERAQLLSIFDNFPQAVLVIDPESGEALYTNPPAQSDIGTDRSSPAFDSIAEVAMSDHDTPGHPREVRMPDSHIWFRVVPHRIQWPDGRTVICILAQECTKERELIHERILRQKMESIGTLAGGIAHDFNNILTGIMGNIGLLEITHHDDESVEILDAMLRACQRATSLNRKILTFASGGEPNRKLADLNSLVVEISSFCLQGSSIQPRFHLDSQLPEFKFDPLQIGQVLQNLVLNARDAAPQNDTIDISTRFSTDSGEVVIRIRDHGPGIPEDVLPRIFDPYFTTKDSGHGLGLACAYSIMEQHQGSIAISDSSETGTEFVCRLPVRETGSVPKPSRLVSTGNISAFGKGKRILVMDDEKALRDVLTRSLGKMGFAVETSADGDEAIVKSREAQRQGQPFDGYIMDVTIPGGLSGPDALKQIRDWAKDTPAIVCSGYSKGAVMQSYGDYGFQATLAKPFTLEELQAVLREQFA